ncbi:hypothetical protein B0682_05460 [Moraxella lincolnii]|uniref:Uncharacterized protein n=1 Tax=Lwoffella lincolnii TaxID=90241 RepID=A0A1T0CE24_9GAMM|nr:hypothetical protein B0682_05460 [Moraxella lincolnii]
MALCLVVLSVKLSYFYQLFCLSILAELFLAESFYWVTVNPISSLPFASSQRCLSVSEIDMLAVLILSKKDTHCEE